MKKLNNWWFNVFILPVKIKKARTSVKYYIDWGVSGYGQKYIENSKEILELLGLKDNLLSNLYVRDFIANPKVSIKQCIDFIKNSGKTNV